MQQQQESDKLRSIKKSLIRERRHYKIHTVQTSSSLEKSLNKEVALNSTLLLKDKSPIVRFRSLNPKTESSQKYSKIMAKQVLMLRSKYRIASKEKIYFSEMVQKGKQFYNKNDMDEAITIFKKLLHKQNNCQILYFLGSAFLNKNKYESAIYYLNELVQKQPNYSKNAYLLLSIGFKNLKQFKTSIKILKNGIQKMGEFEQGFFYIAKLYMKLKDYASALEYFNKTIELNPTNALNYISTADCLRKLDNKVEAIKFYTKAIALSDKYQLVSRMKRMSAYFELNDYQRANEDIDILLSNNVNSSEIYYFKAAILDKSEINDAHIYYEMALTLNNSNIAVTKSLEAMVKSKIKLRDFYSAQYCLNRTKYLNVNTQYLRSLSQFVEAIIDCMKKRYNQAIKKLQEINTTLETGFSYNHKQYSYSALIREIIPQYLGYCYFSVSNYRKALKYFNTPNHQTNYNKSICEAIILHKQFRFKEAARKFEQSKSYCNNKVEPYFYKAVNLMQEFFTNVDNSNIECALIQMRQGQSIKSNNSLFYFYYTLMLLYNGQPSLYMILKAIDNSDQNIAEYHYIKGIIYAFNAQFEEAILDIGNAINIDANVSQFYKQRSKCYYLQNKYDDALADIKKCLDLRDHDYESKLLLCFYLYAYQRFESALLFLTQLADEDVDHQKLKNFFHCLNFRLARYAKAGLTGEIITCIKFGSKLADVNRMQLLERQIDKKQMMAEFNNVNLCSLKACYQFYNNKYQQAITYFYKALCLIKEKLTQNSKFEYEDEIVVDIETEIKIFEIKFDIILSNIMRKDYLQALTLVRILKADTQMRSLTQTLESFEKHLQHEIDSETTYQQQVNSVVLLMFEQKNLLSKEFPLIEIRLKTIIIKARPILLYPEKFKFNIVPEFNVDLLKNFDISKIEDKPQPPWIKREQSNIYFTQNVYRDQEIAISESQRASVVEEEDRKSSPKTNIKDKLKLADSLEKRLNKFINRP